MKPKIASGSRNKQKKRFGNFQMCSEKGQKLFFKESGFSKIT